jgi:hypothetical protein
MGLFPFVKSLPFHPETAAGFREFMIRYSSSGCRGFPLISSFAFVIRRLSGEHAVHSDRTVPRGRKDHLTQAFENPLYILSSAKRRNRWRRTLSYSDQHMKIKK